MKIFYITDIDLQENAAQTVHVDQVCTHLVQLKHKVVLYSPRTHNFRTDKRNYQTKLFWCPRFARTVFFQFILVFRLSIDVLRQRPEAIYSRHSLLLFVPNIVGRLFGVPVVLEVNGKLILEARNQKITLLGIILINSGFCRILESYNFRSASRIICVTRGIRDYVLGEYSIDNDSVHAVSNGVNPTFFQPRSQGEARKQVNLSLDFIYIGYVGSTFSWQGLRYVAEAALRMRDLQENVKFVLVGGGEDTPYLESFVNEHNLQESLLLIPPVSRDLVVRYINAFDICLSVPVRFRSGGTSPFKVYEYLACGKPVIQSDIEGMREEFKNVVKYTEPESAEALVGTIMELVASPKERDHLGKRGRKFIETEGSWLSVADKVSKICSDAVQDRGSKHRNKLVKNYNKITK